jgi:hypothetical protein
MHNCAAPLLEVERFYAAPPDRHFPRWDEQSRAVQRLVLTCARLRPHLRDLDSLESFIGGLHDPPRVRRRISLALAMLMPETKLPYGQVDRGELETFRVLAQRRLGAVVWVFS